MSLEDLDSLPLHGGFRSCLSHFKHLRMNGLVERVLAVAAARRLVQEVALRLAERRLQVEWHPLCRLELVIRLSDSMHVHVQ